MQETKKHIINFFKELEYNDKHHLYYVNNNRIKYSVSGLIKNFIEPFDSKNISKFVALKRNITQEEVLKEWEDKKNTACQKGTEVHLFGELFSFNKELKPQNNFEKAIVKFYEDLPSYIVPVLVELKMYHKIYPFAGTTDIVLYNTKTDTYIIGDWKTNKDLFKNYKGKRMLKPFNFLLDNPYNKYQLQLSFYQILFEQIGLRVSSRKLIWLLPNGNYKLYSTNNYTEILNEYLKNTEL